MNVSTRRVVAWLVDWGCIVVWAAATAVVGVSLLLAGVIATTNPFAQNVTGAVVVIVPVVVAAAWCESRPVGATPGKRLMGLVVLTNSRRVPFRLALLRNFLKLGVPWLIGHAAVYAIVTSSNVNHDVPAAVWVLTGFAYLIPIVWIVSLFVGDGRTPYDRICGTNVGRRCGLPGRSLAPAARR
ncbi:MAG: RDD family protein [Leifsonia sp.]